MIKTPITDLEYFLGITPIEESVLSFIKSNPGTTNSEIIKNVNINKSCLSTSLNEMKDAGYLLKSFKNRIAHWSLNKEHYSFELLQPIT